MTPSTPLRAGEIERLAFIKYMVMVARHQLAQPEPQAAIGVLALHDVIELFLQLVAEHLLAPVDKKTGFLDYWTKCRAVGTELPYLGTMRRLNDQRVALKHHGVIPRREDLIDFEHVSVAFLDETTSAAFGIRFGDVSLADVIHETVVRDQVRDAEKALATSAFNDSLKASAGAMESLISDYEARKRDRWHRSPFFAGGDQQFSFHHSRELQRSLRRSDEVSRLAGDVDKELEKIWKQLEAFQGTLRIVLLGFDYRKWARFEALTPEVFHTMDGQRHIGELRLSVGREEAEFCIEFVIETALRFQEFDFAAIDGMGVK